MRFVAQIQMFAYQRNISIFVKIVKIEPTIINYLKHVGLNTIF